MAFELLEHFKTFGLGTILVYSQISAVKTVCDGAFVLAQRHTIDVGFFLDALSEFVSSEGFTPGKNVCHAVVSSRDDNFLVLTDAD